MINHNQISKIASFFNDNVLDLTWQKIKFWDIVANKFGYENAIKNKETVKRKFMLWQSNEKPNCTNSKKFESIGTFSHKDDASWSLLSLWFDYVDTEIEYLKKPVNPEILDMLKDEFPL